LAIEPCFTFNIALIGPVSAGKSTLLNAILSDTYSDMKLRRTTMCPQIYTESANQLLASAQQVRQTNAEINQQILEQRTGSDAIDQQMRLRLGHAQVRPQQQGTLEVKEYDIKPITDFPHLIRPLKYRIYDIPGLNDQGSSVYFDYIRKNFHQFDLVLLVFDIQSGLNRTDELEVLSEVAKLMKAHPTTQTMIVANKSDDMTVDQNGPRLDDDEYQELYDQMLQTCVRISNQYDIRSRMHLLPLSAELLYIYRTFKNNPQCQIDEKYIDRLAHNEMGKVQWQRICRQVQPQDLVRFKQGKIRELLKSQSSSTEESIQNTGFYHLTHLFNQVFNPGVQQLMAVKKWVQVTVSPALGSPLSQESMLRILEEGRCLGESCPRAKQEIEGQMRRVAEHYSKWLGATDEGTGLIGSIWTLVDKIRTKIGDAYTAVFVDLAHQKLERYLLDISKQSPYGVDFDQLDELKRRHPDVLARLSTEWLSKGFNVKHGDQFEPVKGWCERLKRHYSKEVFGKLMVRFYQCWIWSITTLSTLEVELAQLLWEKDRLDRSHQSAIKRVYLENRARSVSLMGGPKTVVSDVTSVTGVSMYVIEQLSSQSPHRV
jgi:GTP-binding protein EngB required for normal cell division